MSDWTARFEEDLRGRKLQAQVGKEGALARRADKKRFMASK